MSILSADTQKKVEQAVIDNGLLSPEEMNKLRQIAKDKGIPLFSLLVSGNHITNEQLTKTIAHVTRVPYVNLSEARIDSKILSLLQQEIAERYMAVPLGEMKNRLAVAMLDADNIQAVDFLSNKIGRALKVYSASEEGIRRILKQYETNLGQDVATALDTQIADQESDEKAEHTADGKKIQSISHDSPISKALSAILEYAANNGASDIHIEALENMLRIRARIDGVLREVMQLPKSTEAPLISRIKILSNLKIDEHRIPQDGQFTVRVGEKAIDLRIAISPVIWGEQVVIRLLDKSGTTLKLEDMGYHGRALKTIRAGLEQSNGMILTSGPTGSGKSTSLYALLQEIKSDEINIVTLEDPVEYKMSGINQIQVHADVGLTFASGLRSILRQDPNVVMVGEIRDGETAGLAVQAALTGHLVFSTLHTNSAAGILPRLLDMGIEPFLIASTVKTVIGQRLVRRLVPGGEAYTSSNTETAAIKETIGHLLPKNKDEAKSVANDLGYDNLPLSTDSAYTLFKGKISPEAPNGLKGRMGLYEVFEIDEDIQELILRRATSAEIQHKAIKQGMVSMREDGYLKALAGMTTLDEVNRVAAAEIGGAEEEPSKEELTQQKQPDEKQSTPESNKNDQAVPKPDRQAAPATEEKSEPKPKAEAKLEPEPEKVEGKSIAVAQTTQPRIEVLLEEVIKKKASDLHLQVGLNPTLRIDGALAPISGTDVLTEETVESLIFAILDEDQKQILLKDKEFDFSFAFGDLGRFRVNAFHERGNLAAALRLIPNEILTIEQLGLPAIMSKMADYPRGLVLVTGPTGSGKSTTLAALVDKINSEKPVHILTIEDPVEFTHVSKKAVLVQREVHYDTFSFSAALRSSLRQDPDVVLIGEMRDLETIASAITIAETGHLVFATLHTNSAAQSIDRMIDVFPPHQQPQIRSQLSNILMGICSQRLVPTIGGGRTVAAEILVATPAVRNIIREGKTHQLDAVIQTGAEFGMQSMDKTLVSMIHAGTISYDDARNYAIDIEELDRLMRG